MKFKKITNYKHLVILVMYGITQFENFNANYRIPINRKLGVGVSVTEAIQIKFNDSMNYAAHWCKWENYDFETEVELIKLQPKMFMEKYKITEKDYKGPTRSWLFLKKVAETINPGYTLDVAMVKENLLEDEINYIKKLIKPEHMFQQNKWQRKNFITGSLGAVHFVNN